MKEGGAVPSGARTIAEEPVLCDFQDSALPAGAALITVLQKGGYSQPGESWAVRTRVQLYSKRKRNP